MPTGTDGDKTINNLFNIPSSGGDVVVLNYNKLKIGPNGILRMPPDAKWLILGVKDSCIIDGRIEANNGANLGGTFTATTPDGISLAYTIVQTSGGNGGSSGAASQANCCGASCGFGSPSCTGGYGSFGNGGGGAAGPSPRECNSNNQFCSAPVICNVGGNASAISSGEGAISNPDCRLAAAAVTTYGGNGNPGAFPINGFYIQSGGGGSGGHRGYNGQGVYLKALKGITGVGTIDISGQNGGNGGEGGFPGGDQYLFGGGGGGGGGAAGGSGGKLNIDYFDSISININIELTAGVGGIGGAAINGSGSIGANGLNGQNGYSDGIVNQRKFEYQWLDNGSPILGANSASYAANSASQYSLILKDNGTCTNTSNVITTKIDQPISSLIQAASNLTICQGDSAKLEYSFSGSHIGYTFTWLFFGNPVPDLLISQSFYYAKVGGDYSLKITNSCGDFNSINTLTVVVNPKPNAQVTANPNYFCPGGSTQLNGSSGGATYQWERNGFNIPNATTQVYVALVPGAYKLQVTNSYSCLAVSASLSISQLTAIVNAGNDTAFYCGSGYTINPIYNPSNPTSVSWSPSTFLNSASSATPYCLPNQTTTYVVNATLSNGCTAKDTLVVTANPAINPGICLITVDSLSEHNVIVWEKQPNVTNIDSFRIYREDVSNIYQYVASIDYNQFSSYTDLSALADPKSKSSRYKLIVIDDCGQISESKWHNTILLLDQQNGNFSWNFYLVESQSATLVSQYILQRFDSTSSTWQFNNSTAGTQNTIISPDYNTHQYSLYRVIADLGSYSCTPTQRSESSISVTRSNIKNKVAPGGLGTNKQMESKIKLQPNPASQIVLIKSELAMEQISIIDFLGRVVLDQFVENSKTSNTSINISKLAAGVYTVLCKGGDFEVRKKLVVD